jgi:hypothetical protein
MLVPARALQAVQDMLKSVDNEGQFTLEAKTIFSPHLAFHCSWVTETSNIALRTHAL